MPFGVVTVVYQGPYVRWPLGVSPSDLLGGLPFLQSTLDERGKGYIVQSRDDEVCPGIGQLLLVAETRHADRRHAASLGCLHATRRILDDETHLR